MLIESVGPGPTLSPSSSHVVGEAKGGTVDCVGWVCLAAACPPEILDRGVTGGHAALRALVLPYER